MSSSDYRSEMTRAMSMLAARPDTLFLGQAVAYPGTTMSATFDGVPKDRKIELPVAEEMQLGMSIGLAMQGWLPISVFPRWNFLILATNQLVNHLDKYRTKGTMGWSAKVIIRVGVGSGKPLWPGVQHVGDFTEQFAELCPHVAFRQLRRADDILPAYEAALERRGSSVMVEYAEMYG